MSRSFCLGALTDEINRSIRNSSAMVVLGLDISSAAGNFQLYV